MMPKSADKPEVQDIKQQAEKSADTVKVAEVGVNPSCTAGTHGTGNLAWQRK